ncbi:MAG: hypothetical protein IJY61_05860 [Candidatus Gastranaerophilales bacterium]|nr:hypothetical protein [Candidatus Gastranaerophilales bacterium]
MGKIFAIVVIGILTANTCFALGLELSDVIKEARELQKSKLAENQTKENAIQPVKNEVQNNSKVAAEEEIKK